MLTHMQLPGEWRFVGLRQDGHPIRLAPDRHLCGIFQDGPEGMRCGHLADPAHIARWHFYPVIPRHGQCSSPTKVLSPGLDGLSVDKNPPRLVGVPAPPLSDSPPVDARVEGSYRTVLYGCPEALVIFSIALAAK